MEGKRFAEEDIQDSQGAQEGMIVKFSLIPVAILAAFSLLDVLKQKLSQKNKKNRLRFSIVDLRALGVSYFMSYVRYGDTFLV